MHAVIQTYDYLKIELRVFRITLINGALVVGKGEKKKKS